MWLKTLLLVLAVHSMLTTLAKGDDALPAAVKEKCRQEFELRKEDVEMLDKAAYVETDDESKKCYFKCLLSGLKLMNDKGEFTPNEELNEKYAKHFSACINTTGSDVCDKAVNFHNCMKKLIDADAKSSK